MKKMVSKRVELEFFHLPMDDVSKTRRLMYRNFGLFGRNGPFGRIGPFGRVVFYFFSLFFTVDNDDDSQLSHLLLLRVFKTMK